MGEAKPWRIEIDGADYTEDCDSAEISTPALVYDVPHTEGAQRRVLGPKGFTITLTNPSERLRALVDGGDQGHPLIYAIHGYAIPVQVQFHEEWVERSGVRKMFGCLAASRDTEPRWVDDPQLAEAQA